MSPPETVPSSASRPPDPTQPISRSGPEAPCGLRIGQSAVHSQCGYPGTRGSAPYGDLGALRLGVTGPAGDQGMDAVRRSARGRAESPPDRCAPSRGPRGLGTSVRGWRGRGGLSPSDTQMSRATRSERGPATAEARREGGPRVTAVPECHPLPPGFRPLSHSVGSWRLERNHDYLHFKGITADCRVGSVGVG